MIDAEGRTVIPGLFDTHDHSGWYSVDTTPVAATSVLRGVTSYGDAGSETYWLTQQVEAIESGRITGPRIFRAGSEITGTAANVQFPQLQASTAQHVERYLDHLDALGLSHVKAYNPWYPDVEAAVIRGAHQRGLPALSHFLRPSAVAAGLDRKEHVSLQGRAWLVRFRGDVLELLTKMRITLGVTFPDRYATAAGAAEERRAFLDNVRLAHRAGVHLAVGTDANVSIHDMLELLVAAGISPCEALRAATRDAAATLGVEGRLGTISEGAIADLVVLEADPLVDISNARRVWAVVKNGRWINSH